MPEGDTLFRTAVVLRQAIGGQAVTGFSSPLPGLRDAEFENCTVEKVEARGKNLLIYFSDGRVLHSHLRMEGSWHIYRPGEKWQRPQWQAKVTIETPGFVAVCFNAPTVELMTAKGLARHEQLNRLGPDLLGPQFDYDSALQRLRLRNANPIGEAIMRQDTVAGVGNVYKSEVLFLCQVNPFAPVSQLNDHDLKQILAKSRELLQKNVGGGQRVTRSALDGGHYWVYGRSGTPCRRCGTTIRMRRQGLEGRSTYWCPRCQSQPAG